MACGLNMNMTRGHGQGQLDMDADANAYIDDYTSILGRSYAKSYWYVYIDIVITNFLEVTKYSNSSKIRYKV
jgi:hypothetical protein